MAYEKAFQPTPVGIIEIKTLPAGRLIMAQEKESYFNASGSLFRPLFRHIQQNDISMTVPVEARIKPGQMLFWISPDQRNKADESTAEVTVIDVPERRVVAAGGKGSYNEENFRRLEQKLLKWLSDNPNWEAVGEATGVYWSGPMTPWFLKSFEVQFELVESVKNEAGQSIIR